MKASTLADCAAAKSLVHLFRRSDSRHEIRCLWLLVHDHNAHINRTWVNLSHSVKYQKVYFQTYEPFYLWNRLSSPIKVLEFPCNRYDLLQVFYVDPGNIAGVLEMKCRGSCLATSQHRRCTGYLKSEWSASSVLYAVAHQSLYLARKKRYPLSLQPNYVKFPHVSQRDDQGTTLETWRQ
jgi:hypothetical protein